jgi:hypothetical protein
LLMWWPKLSRTPFRPSERKKSCLFKTNYEVFKPSFKIRLMQRLDSMNRCRKPTPSSKPSPRSSKPLRQSHMS